MPRKLGSPGQSPTVFDSFQNAVEATRETVSADSQLERISEMKKISQAMKVNAEAVQRVRQYVLLYCDRVDQR
jgi:hypothetical protein